MNNLKMITNTISDIKEISLAICSETKKKVCDFFGKETTVTRKTMFIICIISVLTGIIYGFLIAPIKKGIQVNVTNHIADPYEEEDDWE